MRPNTRMLPQGCLNTLALVLASLSVSLGLWAGFGLAVGLLEPYQPPEPVCGEPGTDSWIECTYGEDMDLTPIIEDEAQTMEGERA